MSPRLDLVVGCNGAGKSTLIHSTLLKIIYETLLVNADDIARQRWPDDPEGNSYEAARIASSLRQALIASRRSFIAETVFSHPSKIELLDEASSAGFSVYLHVVMIPEDLAVARVATRVEKGGHSVPEHKIRERYRRLWPLVAQAAEKADRIAIYDNADEHMRLVVSFDRSSQRTDDVDWPDWTPEALRQLHSNLR
ncbi:MAG: zeta toxin family protein [Gordonia sp. (in: high G+C Gram-positive bacteria)]